MSLVSQEAKVKTVGGEGKEHIKETPPSPPSKKQQHPKEKEKERKLNQNPNSTHFVSGSDASLCLDIDPGEPFTERRKSASCDNA